MEESSRSFSFCVYHTQQLPPAAVADLCDSQREVIACCIFRAVGRPAGRRLVLPPPSPSAALHPVTVRVDRRPFPSPPRR